MGSKQLSLVRWCVVLTLASVVPLVANADEWRPAEFRPAMKRQLELQKKATPRLPLPDYQEGDTSIRRVNNGRMRATYLPTEWFGSDFRRDPAMTLDDVFTVKLFWVVSRVNDCQYCLGHQELKLSHSGVPEDVIAALDCDWTEFDPTLQMALGFCRKLTFEPHRVAPEDVVALRSSFSDPQIVEMIHRIAQFNSVNRWTDSLGIPQDEGFFGRTVQLDTPTSERFQSTPTKVAVEGTPSRPSLEPRAEVERLLAAGRAEPAAIELPDEKTVRAVFGAESDTVPTWGKALAYFSELAPAQIQAREALASTGKLSPRIKAELSWVTARHNRAGYALADAYNRLRTQGATPDEIFALDSPSSLDPARGSAMGFAEKLTVRPQRMEDEDIASLRRHYSDHEVAEIVYVVCAANGFDRLTEALRLPFDPVR